MAMGALNCLGVRQAGRMYKAPLMRSIIAFKLSSVQALIVCMTTYEDRLPGDPLFKPIWDKLDVLGAVVFIHPAAVNIVPHQVAPIVSQPIIDYPQQTTRTAVDLVFTGTLRAHPNLKLILSHVGGTLPYLADRVSGIGADISNSLLLIKYSLVQIGPTCLSSMERGINGCLTIF
ncbi:hypothetical protein K439DRAFT_398575 [Ramaria rubella]|nr:hypothetical protein K439DRAFT_398575 [Ramaria rubella]